MQVILRQSFLLGRLHATPWRVNPYDDPSGEWPPSPWRMVRAVVARWYQWERESRDGADRAELDALVSALCACSYSFRLPVAARRGSPLRQYQPVEFGWVPKLNKPPRMKTYWTSLVQDNYWAIPRGESGDVWWYLDGNSWTPELLNGLDRCLERMIYFGRAETFTAIGRVETSAPEPNCRLSLSPGSPHSVRVLTPQPNATRTDLERVTDDPEVASRSVPPGARLLYADLPARVSARRRSADVPARPDCSLIQLAVGWTVAPEVRATVHFTARFRSAVISELLLLKSNGQCRSWSAAGESLRTAVAEMVGKDAGGMPLKGHRHSEFLAWWENGLPTRILVWRGGRAFDCEEQDAVFRAAGRAVSWATAGRQTDAWKIRLLPLDQSVSPPAGFDARQCATWESVTPYVPPRHHLRGGRSRESEAIINQVRRELRARDVANAELTGVEEIGPAEWVGVYLPPSKASTRAFLGDRLGYGLRLRFREPVAGPLRLGHSSSLGLGLFKPTEGLERTEALRFPKVE